MVYEWDEKRARRSYWAKIGVTWALLAAAIGASVWVATAFDLGF
jgi:hypothetical protein